MMRVATVIALILAFALLFLACLAGCTRVESYHDSRAWLVGVGHTLTRSTTVTATDAKSTDVSPETELRLPDLITHTPQDVYHVRLPKGGATMPTWQEAAELARQQWGIE